MCMNSKRLILPLFLIINLMYAQNNSIDFRDFDSEMQIFNKAKKENKFVFVVLHYKGCGYCRLMEKNVFTDKNVIEYFNNNFISLSLDIDKYDLGKHFKAKAKVRSFPTSLFYNKDGVLVHKYSGYQDAEEFIKTASLSRDSIKNMLFYESKIKTGNYTINDLTEYLAINIDCSSKDSLISNYLTNISEEEKYNNSTWQLLTTNVRTYHSKWFDYIVNHEQDFRNTIDGLKVDSFLVQNWSFMVWRYALTLSWKNKIAEKKEELRVLNHSLYDKIITHADFMIALERFAYRKKNNARWNTLIEQANKYINSTNYEWANLNRAAWQISENYKSFNDSIGLVIGLKCAEKSIAYNRNWNNLNTYSCLKYLKGEKGKAIEIIKEALLLAKSENDYKILQERIDKWTRKD